MQRGKLKKNIFSFFFAAAHSRRSHDPRCAHFISPRCTNTYSCLVSSDFFFALRCDYDDVDDIQRSATLAMRMRFIIIFVPFFSPPLVYTLYAVHILWHRHTNAQPSFFASRFAPKKKTHSNQINSCVTCINITPNEFSLQRAKLKTHKKSLLFEMNQGGESYSHVFRFLDSL